MKYLQLSRVSSQLVRSPCRAGVGRRPWADGGGADGGRRDPLGVHGPTKDVLLREADSRSTDANCYRAGHL